MKSLWLAAALMLLASPVQADDASQTGLDETVGRWTFRKAERPVKVVTIAGSIGAWPKGSFSEVLEGACKNVEIANLSKVGYGAWALKQRFRQKVVKNRRLGLEKSPHEHWLLYAGGMNSVGTPELTNRYMSETFALAHEAGMKVVAFTLTPWGEEGDRRWKGFAALKSWENTRRVVDFVLGRIGRVEALGAHAKDVAEWQPGERPDIAVDLYDSELRDRDAALRDEAPLRRSWDRSRKLQKLLPDAAKAIREAAGVPRWFMKKGLRSFDHIHPNGDGHRIIARTACPKLPASWGCDCNAI